MRFLISLALVLGLAVSQAQATDFKDMLKSVVCKQFDDDGFTTLKSFRLLRYIGAQGFYFYKARFKTGPGRKAYTIKNDLLPKFAHAQTFWNKDKQAWQHSYDWQFEAREPLNTPYVFLVDINIQPFWSDTHRAPLRGVYPAKVSVHTASCAMCLDTSTEHKFDSNDCMAQVSR